MSLSPASRSVAATSRKRGSPNEPGSFVRSSTATFLAVLGSTLSIASEDQGRYKRTLIRPTFSPAAVR